MSYRGLHGVNDVSLTHPFPYILSQVRPNPEICCLSPTTHLPTNFVPTPLFVKTFPQPSPTYWLVQPVCKLFMQSC